MMVYIRTEYAYDTMDRVTNISWRTSNGASLGGFAYEYDAVGRIVSRSHALGTNAFDRAYAYDDLDRLASDGGVSYTYDAAGNRTTIDNLLAVKIGGSTYYPLTDIQGTVWGYVDTQNNIVARWQYDAWGNVVVVLFGDGFLGNALDFLNPLSDIQDMFDLADELYNGECECGE